MSDTPQVTTPQQIEAARFRSAISEGLMTSMQGNINYLLASILPVGSVVHSMLDESQFQTATSTGWVLAVGQNVAGSDYAVITGFTTVPDMRGVFIRGKNAARSTSTGNAAGDLALGTYQADTVQAHTHSVTASWLPESGGPIEHDDGSEFSVNNVTTTGAMNSGNSSAETRVRNVTLNAFIRIN